MSVNAAADNQLRVRPMQNTWCEKGCTASEYVLDVALFVIGCVAVAGWSTGNIVVGWCAVGINVGILLTNLFQGKTVIRDGQLKDRTIQFLVQTIIALALIIIGSLAIHGYISTLVTGWCMMAPILLSFMLDLCCNICERCQR